MTTIEPCTQFDYLLNAMELASQSDKPADHGYGEKRRALFAYVRELELAQETAASRATECEQKQPNTDQVHLAVNGRTPGLE